MYSCSTPLKCASLTSSKDATARLWDVATGKQLMIFAGHTDGINSGYFSRDGKTIVTASDDKTARLWPADYHDTIRALCTELTRDLTPDERAQYGIADQEPTYPAH